LVVVVGYFFENTILLKIYLLRFWFQFLEIFSLGLFLVHERFVVFAQDYYKLSMLIHLKGNSITRREDVLG